MPQIILGKVVKEDRIKIVDTSSSGFDPSTFDFTQFKPGDVIIIVSDMEA